MKAPLLLKPGPVQVPREVLEAGAAPMSHHTASAFQAMFKQLMQGLRPIFGNDGAILIQNSSGRGAMEASLTNVFNPGDAVAVMVNGRFGLRFAGIARDMGLVVHEVSPEWGHTASESAIADTLTKHPEIKGLIGSMCETGQGVVNDLDMIGRMGKRFGVVTVVDAVSAAAGMPIRMKEQNIDVCFSGIQKCFMSPPGLAIVAVNEQAWQHIKDSKHYRHYFNWVKMRQWIEDAKPKLMGTPPESLLRSLACAVSMIHKEGLDNVYARHALLAKSFHAFVHAVDCELAAKDAEYRSHTVSAIVLPPGMKSGDVVKRVLENDNVALATGQDSQKDSVIRFGHMGGVQPAMMLRGVEALALAMGQCGLEPKKVQAGIDACADVLGIRGRAEKKLAEA